MNDVALGELLVRMVVSLGVVLLLVLGAYLVMKRRQGGAAMSTLGRAATLVRRPAREGGNQNTGGRTRPGTGRNALRVLGRAGVGRSSNVIAIQFADRVLLVGANDATAPVLLADLGLEQWHAAAEGDEREAHLRATPLPIDPAHLAGADHRGGARPVEQSDAVAASLGLIEALREATARRG